MTEIYNDYNFTLAANEEDSRGEFTVLEPGEYAFTVVKVEPGFYEPKTGSKAPRCRSVSVTLMVEQGKDKVFIVKEFLLYSDLAWLIRQFFISLGMGKHGEEIQIHWDKTKGRRGRVKLKKVPGRSEGTWFNNVEKFLDPAPSSSAQPEPEPKAEEEEEPEEEEIPFDF